LDESILNQIYKFLQVVFRDHPFPALRAKEIHAWASSTEYKNIMDGIYPQVGIDVYSPSSYSYDFSSRNAPPPWGYSPEASTAAAPTTCPNWGVGVEGAASFCHVCGAKIFGSIAVVDKPGPGASADQSGKEPPQPPPPKQDKTPLCKICNAPIKLSDEYCPSC